MSQKCPHFGLLIAANFEFANCKNIRPATTDAEAKKANSYRKPIHLIKPLFAFVWIKTVPDPFTHSETGYIM